MPRKRGTRSVISTLGQRIMKRFTVILFAVVIAQLAFGEDESDGYFKNNTKFGIYAGYPLIASFDYSFCLYDTQFDSAKDKGIIGFTELGVNGIKAGLGVVVRNGDWALLHSPLQNFNLRFGYMRLFDVVDDLESDYVGVEIGQNFTIITGKIGYWQSTDDSDDNLIGIQIGIGY